jgi:hypothetical protein
MSIFLKKIVEDVGVTLHLGNVSFFVNSKKINRPPPACSKRVHAPDLKNNEQ